MTGERLMVSQAVLVCAFRYALGRISPAVGEVADELIAHAPRIESWQRRQMVQDIDRAIGAGAAGMDMDVEVWRGVREVLAELDRAPEVDGG